MNESGVLGCARPPEASTNPVREDEGARLPKWNERGDGEDATACSVAAGREWLAQDLLPSLIEERRLAVMLAVPSTSAVGALMDVLVFGNGPLTEQPRRSFRFLLSG